MKTFITSDTCAVGGGTDSLILYPPVYGTDTLEVRGFIVGARSVTVKKESALEMVIWEKGSDGDQKWDEYYAAGNKGHMPILGVRATVDAAGIDGVSTCFFPACGVEKLIFWAYGGTDVIVGVTWFLHRKMEATVDWSDY